jgi:short-subunit dehydrogenase
LITRGKVVLITGASRGIGEACAQAFARRGAMLSLGARASRSACALPEALSSEVDLTLAADRKRLVERTIERYGRIDVLVNNAGSGLYGPTETVELSAAMELFQLNLFAALGMVQLVLPIMRAQGSGHIVNVSSIAAEVPLPWMTMYSASKAALSAVSSGVRRELRGTGVSVTDVLPGYVTTSFQGSAVGKPPAGVLGARRHAISPEQCAEAIVRGVERGARTVVTPRYGWLAIWAERFAPWMVDSPLSKMNR